MASISKVSTVRLTTHAGLGQSFEPEGVRFFFNQGVVFKCANSLTASSRLSRFSPCSRLPSPGTYCRVQVRLIVGICWWAPIGGVFSLVSPLLPPPPAGGG